LEAPGPGKGLDEYHAVRRFPMATIGETVDLGMPVEEARKKWSEYVSGMVIGSGLGPGEHEYPFRWRKEEREADQGVVQFVAIGDDTTRFSVALDFPELDTRDEEAQRRVERLRALLRYDLDLFKEYSEGRLRIAS
jgi:hypothetical protein